MSSVLARYEVSGERRKPKPSGSTSSVPSPKIDSPFFAWFFSSAKIRSCFRMRLAFSMPLETAISTSCVTWWDLSSERCVGIGNAPAGVATGACASGRWDERVASGWTAWGLLILGICASGFLRRSVVAAAPDLRRGSQNRVRRLDIAVKESGELRFGKRADPGRLDVAVLEEHQRRNSADAELRRRVLVLIDIDLCHLEAPLVFLRHFVEDRGDRLARPAPLGPVVDQHGRIGLQHLGLERLVGDMTYLLTAHGSPLGVRQEGLYYASGALRGKLRASGSVLNY